MMEANYMDLSNIGIEEVEEEGKKYLLTLDKDLQIANEQYKIQKDICAELRLNIVKYEKQLEAMNDDIHTLEELKHKLICVPEFINNQVEKFNELEVLINKKKQNYLTLQELHKQIKENFNKSRENLITSQERLEQSKQLLQEKKNNLSIYDKWITVLVNRSNNLFSKINEMDEDLKTTIMGSTDVSDPVIMELKVVVDYKRFHIDRKIGWYNDTVATLSNTREKFETVTESIESVKEEIINLEKQIFDETVALEKVELEKNASIALVEKTERQLNQYLEMQETYNRKEKLRTSEELLFIHWKEYCDLQQQENINRNKLFSQSLDLSMLESKIAFLVTKRDEIEAQIALRLSAPTH